MCPVLDLPFFLDLKKCPCLGYPGHPAMHALGSIPLLWGQSKGNAQLDNNTIQGSHLPPLFHHQGTVGRILRICGCLGLA